MEHVSMQIFIRYAFKQCVNNYQIHSWPIIAVIMTFEAKKSINLISNLGCPIIHALKIINDHHCFCGLHGCRCII